MNFYTHLALGRVSNLPTVLSNVLAAGALAGVTFAASSWVPLMVAMCLFYIAGMYYNDACDAEYDRVHQPQRPIAKGHISCERVKAYALAYVLVAFVLVYFARLLAPLAQASGNSGWLFGALALLICIVTYNHHHKQNPYSPALMAACRLSVLLTTSYTLSAKLPMPVVGLMLATCCWLIGLTYLAKKEQHLAASGKHILPHWTLLLLCLPLMAGLGFSLSSPAILLPLSILCWVVYSANTTLKYASASQKGLAIALLIAGICLIDGLFLAWVWGIAGAIASIIAFGLTLTLQRWVAGT